MPVAFYRSQAVTASAIARLSSVITFHMLNKALFSRLCCFESCNVSCTMTFRLKDLCMSFHTRCFGLVLGLP